MPLNMELKSLLKIDLDKPEKNAAGSNYAGLLDKALRIFFWNAFRVCVRNPKQALAFSRTIQDQMHAAKIRDEYAKEGIHIPPIMIFSITSRCNLNCKGCYHWSLRNERHEELNAEKLKQVIAEASGLGISFVVIAGGEPLIRRELLEITAEHPNILFLVFTNGLLIDDDVINKLHHQHNVIPLISLEGDRWETDNRRGEGIYERLEKIIAKLKMENIFWGISLTVTGSNVNAITEDNFVRNLNDLGCQFFLFIEYTPVSKGTEEWVITGRQRADLNRKIADFRDHYSALFVSVPGDEEEFGGCLAGGRGFVHISAEGNVEPCPFVPYSDSSLKDMSLKDALQSDFLKIVRENSHLLEENSGGCSLWNKKEWLNAALSECRKK